MSSPVVQACFIVHVNFEVHQALISDYTRNAPSLRVDYRTYPFPSLESPVDDVAWGNRILWICARVLQWSQGDVRTLEEWYELKDMVEKWENERPNTFDTFFYQEPGERTCQESWFPDPCHGEFKYAVLFLTHY
jgi:hypothetical protein